MKKITIIIIFVATIILIWGIIGAVITNDIKYTCDFGVDNLLCWKWHENLIGKASGFIKDVFN